MRLSSFVIDRSVHLQPGSFSPISVFFFFFSRTLALTLVLWPESCQSEVMPYWHSGWKDNVLDDTATSYLLLLKKKKKMGGNVFLLVNPTSRALVPFDLSQYLSCFSGHFQLDMGVPGVSSAHVITGQWEMDDQFGPVTIHLHFPAPAPRYLTFFFPTNALNLFRAVFLLLG